VYSTDFNFDGRITKAGLEVKVDRAYFKLVEHNDGRALMSAFLRSWCGSKASS
jgi:hypothetical protein